MINVVIVVVGVMVVWAKLRERSGLGERETPLLDATFPMAPRAGAPDTAALRRDPTAAAASATQSSGATSGAAEEVGAGTAQSNAQDQTGAQEQPDVPGSDAGASPGDPPTRLRGQPDAVPAPPAAREAPVPASVHALAATEAVIDRIGVDVEVLHAIRGEYPSSSAVYGANRGIEALHVALAKVGRAATLRLGDTDDDGRLEILDAWGRPLVYFSPDDYRSTQRWVPGDGEAVEIGACRITGSQSFCAAASYQLFSVGPDGRVGGGKHDDITSWVRLD